MWRMCFALVGHLRLIHAQGRKDLSTNQKSVKRKPLGKGIVKIAKLTSVKRKPLGKGIVKIAKLTPVKRKPLGKGIGTM